MKLVAYFCTFLSFAYALPSSKTPHLIFRSSTLDNAAPLVKDDDLDLLASNIVPSTSSELPAGLDITSTGTDNSAILYDPSAGLSDPQNEFYDILSSAGVSESAELLCLDNCQYPDSSIPLGSDLDDGNIFGADLGPDGGIFIPPDDPLGSGPGTWIEVHRGSGRNEDEGSVPLVPEEDWKTRGSGRETPTNENGAGNDISFWADDSAPVS